MTSQEIPEAGPASRKRTKAEAFYPSPTGQRACVEVEKFMLDLAHEIEVYRSNKYRPAQHGTDKRYTFEDNGI
jgi:hypothetical protein